MSEDNLAGDLSADDSAAAASAEVASDDADAAAAEGSVADLLASALISGSAQQADAAIAAYNALGREPQAGGPLKAALPEAEEA